MPDENKMIVINSLHLLVQQQLIKINGYLIMPNHIYLLWEQLCMNGKEFPENSFEKFTAKTLINKMKQMKDMALKNYVVTTTNRQQNIWLRNPLAIKVFSKEVAEQKLAYVRLYKKENSKKYIEG